MKTYAVVAKVLVVCSLAVPLFAGMPEAEAGGRRGWSRGHARWHHPHRWHASQCDFPLALIGSVSTVQYAAPMVEKHRTVVIDGIVYHYYDGTYYKGAPADYVSVPVSVVPAEAKSAETETAEGNEIADVRTVNIPNANGSYTPVRLQLAKDGTYIGPQGEVYPTEPDIEQLKSMYGK